MLALLALAQIGLYFVLLVKFTVLGPYTYAIMIVIGVLVVNFVLAKDDLNPAYKMMWMMLTVLLPIVGVGMYIVWGNNRMPPKSAMRFAEIEKEAAEAAEPNNCAMEALSQADPSLERMADYLWRCAAAPVYTDTECKFYSSGEEFYRDFIPRLKQAKKCIFMEYFIIDHGQMWDTTLEILKRKVREGVDVRVIFDGVGCLFTLPYGYEKELRKYGIKAYVFNEPQLRRFVSQYSFLNHRDHRKICVIDGETGFSGGLNFADEYINEKERFGYWKDTAFMLKGPAVESLTSTFFKMWSFTAGETPDYGAYPPVHIYPADGFVQPYADTPLDDERVGENVYLNIISRARDYVYMTTPYLVIGYELLTALSLAAKSGVDVRIVTPGIPDKKSVYLLTRSYYYQLLQAGVRIYEYDPGFVHAKMYASDDAVATVGSVNMDFRSLYLHFENGCCFYGGKIVRDVKSDIIGCMKAGHEVTLRDVKKWPWYQRLLMVFFRFFAPLM